MRLEDAAVFARAAILEAHAAIVTARSARKRRLMLKHSGRALDELNKAFGLLRAARLDTSAAAPPERAEP